MSIWMKLSWVALGGALGAMSRYATALLAVRWFGPKYPLGTFAANMIGCLVMGVAFGLSQQKVVLHNEHAKLFLMVGFLGAFTTFSSFALDSVLLMRQQSLTAMLLNLGAQNVLGLLLVLVGVWAAQTFF